MSNSNQAGAESLFIYTIPRAEKDEVQIALRKYKGRFYLDLRVWYQDEEAGGILKPTQRGISLFVEHLDSLKEGIHQLGEACLKIGTAEPKSKPGNPPKPEMMHGQKRQPNAWRRS